MVYGTPIWYVYPFFKHVSFSAIGNEHVKQLKKYFRIEIIDEIAFPSILIATYPLVLLHPYFYPVQKFERKIRRQRSKIAGLIGIDVADTDHLTKYAVGLTKYADALIVPSKHARNVYARSGVRKPIYVVPHGVREEYLRLEKTKPETFEELAKLKEERKLKLLLSYIVHSPYRKGLDLLLAIYAKLLKERGDVLLVLKTAMGVGYFLESIEKIGAVLEHHMDGKVHMGWLTEKQKIELFDLCDLFLLTSRGGGFEHPPLEGLARGLPVIGAKGGAWEDYLPEWLLVESKKSGKIFKENPIHDGCGVEISIDKAVNKAHRILNNLDDYRARVKDYVNSEICKNFTWDAVGKKLRDVILKFR